MLDYTNLSKFNCETSIFLGYVNHAWIRSWNKHQY